MVSLWILFDLRVWVLADFEFSHCQDVLIEDLGEHKSWKTACLFLVIGAR